MITLKSPHAERRRVLAILFTLVIVAGLWVLLGQVSFSIAKADRETLAEITEDKLIRVNLADLRDRAQPETASSEPKEPQPTEDASASEMVKPVTIPDDMLAGASAEAEPMPTPLDQPTPPAFEDSPVQRRRVEENLLTAQHTPSPNASFQPGTPGEGNDGALAVSRKPGNGSRNGKRAQNGDGPGDGPGSGVEGKEGADGKDPEGIRRNGTAPGQDGQPGSVPYERVARWIQLHPAPLPTAIKQLMKADKVGAYLSSHDAFQPPGGQKYDIYLMCVGCSEQAGQYRFHIVLVGSTDNRAIYLVGNGDFGGSSSTLFRYGPARRDAAGEILDVNTSNKADASREAAFSKIFKAWWSKKIN